MDRYDNDRNIVYAHINSLLNLKPITSEAADQLRGLINETTDCLESLKALGAPVNHWNWILVPLVVNRLDSLLRRDWENEIAGTRKPAEYTKLETFLRERL